MSVLLEPDFKFAMFWGCTIQNRLPFIELAIRKVYNKLDIKFEDLPFSCCPDPNGMQGFDFLTWVTLGARNLTLADEKGLNIISACSGCFETLKLANHHLSTDKLLRDKVNKILKAETGREWTGKTKIMHVMEFFTNYLDYNKIKSLIVRPLTEFKFATHVGCHYSKPADIMKTDDPNEPLNLTLILEELLGSTVIPYPAQNDCCGAGLRFIDNDIALSMVNKKLVQIDKISVNATVFICPTCYNSFDAQQKLSNRKFGRKKLLPAFHLFELLALAMGIPESELGLHYHTIKIPKEIFNFNEMHIIAEN
jgi:heterodisulfide reductase subunit B